MRLAVHPIRWPASERFNLAALIAGVAALCAGCVTVAAAIAVAVL